MASDRHALIGGLVALALAGCAPPDELRFRLVRGRDDDPFAFGTEIAIALDAAGTQAAPTQTFPIDAPAFEVGPLPYGTDLRLRAEVRSDGVILARGASFPFDHLATGSSAVDPDVLLGSLGVLTRTTTEQPDDVCLAVLPAPDGARFVTAAGTVYAYRAHGEGGDAKLEVLGRVPPHRRAGRWVAMGREGFVAVGGSAPGATLVGVDAAAEVEAPGALAEHGAAPVLVGFDDGVLVVGGTTTAGPSASVTWLEVRAGALVQAPRAALHAPVASGRGVAVTLEVAGERRWFALVLSDDGLAWVLDPRGARSPRSSSIAIDHLDGAAVAALGPGLVLVAGGRDAAGASARIDLLVASEDGVEVLSPRPLAVERVGAAAIPFGVGRALIVGGRDAFDLARDTSELFEVRVDNLPGDAVPTGRVPVPVGRPMGTAIDDGSVLVLDRDLLAHYFSPRAP